MSAGILIHIPNLDRIMIPFVPFDNGNFLNVLESKLSQAKKGKDHHGNPNYYIIKPLCDLFTCFLKKEIKPEDYNTEALLTAGRICYLIRDAQQVQFKEYEDSLKKLHRTFRKKNVDVMAPGVDQIVARIMFAMTFEDPIMIWDYYALWYEDYCQKIPMPEED